MENLEDASSGTQMMMDKLKSIGNKSYVPIVKLLFKYKDDMLPYFDATLKGLEGACNNLEESSNPEKKVKSYFEQSKSKLEELKSKINESDIESFGAFLKTEADKNPNSMFILSYVAGILLGRLSRYSLYESKSKNVFQ